MKDKISFHLCPRCEWKFQPPTASHMNGIWEKLIPSVHKSMRAILGKLKRAGRIRNLTHHVCWSRNSSEQSSSYSKQRRSEWLWTSHSEPFLASAEEPCSTTWAVCEWRLLSREAMETSSISSWLLLEKMDARVHPSTATVSQMGLREGQLGNRRTCLSRQRQFSTGMVAPWLCFQDLSWSWSMGLCPGNQDKKWYPSQTNLQAMLAWGSSLSNLRYHGRWIFKKNAKNLFFAVQIEKTEKNNL